MRHGYQLAGECMHIKISKYVYIYVQGIHNKTSPVYKSLAAKSLNQSKRKFKYIYMKICSRDRDDLKQ